MGKNNYDVDMTAQSNIGWAALRQEG